jgi:threonine/homoserine/homoserine lactone efflux protein
MVDTTLWGTILFVSIVSMTPGPNNLLLAASGANYGFIKTLPHMCGVIVGFAIMVVASGFGLGMMLNEFPQVILPLKIMSVSFLLYLSWRIATWGLKYQTTNLCFPSLSHCSFCYPHLLYCPQLHGLCLALL